MMASVPLLEVVAFVGAILLLLVAHLIRTMRWALLYPPDRVRRFNLFVGLSIGNVINAVFPLRLGDLVRALYVRRIERVRFSYVLASIVAERITDLVVVGLLVLTFSNVAGFTPVSALSLIALALVLILLPLLAHRSAMTRRFLWKATWPLNNKLRVAVADLVWTTGEMLGKGRVLHPNYLFGTVSMWAGYLGAFALFAWATKSPIRDVNAVMLGDPLSPLVMRILDGPITADEVGLMIFALSPLALILGYGYLSAQVNIGGVVDSIKGFAGFVSDRPLAVATDSRFEQIDQYEEFISALFGGSATKQLAFGLQGVDDARVVRFFNGGSDAVTALVDIGGTLRIRKFAKYAPGHKLSDQANWLETERGRGLPLVEVAGMTRKDETFMYDMPAVTPAADFFEVIHASPPEDVERLFDALLHDTVAFHASGKEGQASEADITAYLSDKIILNVDKILSFINAELSSDMLEINGLVHHVKSWEKFRDHDWLRAQIKDKSIARIHGDLTIENVIVSPVAPNGYYVIDPNPDNKFNTPLIDWAKLMQSLNLGYEGLNRSISVSVDFVEEGRIALRVPLQRSQAYSTLHTHFERFLLDRYGPQGLREVHFHELVNYFRLTPYKIRQDPRRGLGFVACTAVLIDRYLAGEAS